jgi:hypothetical protein
MQPSRVNVPQFTGRLVSTVALTSLLLTATSPASGLSAWRLHARGLGRLVVGMTVSEANTISSAQFELAGSPPEPSASCAYYSGRLADREVLLRVIDGRIDRIEVSSQGIMTVSGIAVGDSIERVREVYGSALSVEPHHYLGHQGVVLMVLGPYGSPQTGYGVAFTASPKTGVMEIRVGWYKGIRESEGCS